jgi:hypothetical protein
MVRLISQKFVKVVEDNADKIAERWVRDIKQNPLAPSYHKFSKEELYHQAFNIYRRLGYWISYETSKQEIADRYMPLGEEWFKDGLPLNEVVYVLITIRRYIWLFLESQGVIIDALSLHQALEFINRVILFFDRAICQAVAGYEKALRESKV